jgi:hypothetical protein
VIGKGKGILRSAYNASNERGKKEEDEENVSICRTRAIDKSWGSKDNDGWGVQRQR